MGILSICLFVTISPLLLTLAAPGNNISQPDSCTRFKVHDKVPEKHKVFINGKGASGIEVIKNQFVGLTEDEQDVIQLSDLSSSLISTKNGFVNSVLEAYRGHHNLVIRPDDVWAAIMVQFSYYVNANAEKFRKKFVKHEGQKELQVLIPSESSFDYFVEQISNKINENLLDSQVKKWILPSFSTTTKNDIVSIGVVFMAAFKKYFTFTGIIICGIPSITLEGTVDDWKDILSRIEKLKAYELQEWHGMLQPILKQFVAAKEGNVDLEFWQKICSLRQINGGCATHEILSGWITVFNLFDDKGRWRGGQQYRDEQWVSLDTTEIASGVVHVPVKVNNNGFEYNATMIGGHVAMEMIEDGYTLKPTLAWAIARSKPKTVEAKIV